MIASADGARCREKTRSLITDYNIRRGHKNRDKNRETAKMMIQSQTVDTFNI